MLDKFKEILKQKKGNALNTPKHIAITLNGATVWAEKNKTSLEDAYRRSGEVVREIIEEQIKNNIPILTFYILPENIEKNSELFLKLLNSIIGFFDEIVKDELIMKNRIKISVLGKWYDLPGRAVDSIKTVIDSTKDYDNFFVNFCINYSGQEEIVDASRLIARQVKAGKLDPDSIDKEIIKENLSSSYFLPPDIFIITGHKKRTSGLLLWDSAYASLYFSNKLWPDFNKADFAGAIKGYKS